MFFAEIRSERHLLEQAIDNLAMRRYAGYNLDEPLPDHSSLSKIRTRLGLPVFRRFFAVSIEQCVQAGLIRGDELIFDQPMLPRGSFLLANAAQHLHCPQVIGNASASEHGMMSLSTGARSAH